MKDSLVSRLQYKWRKLLLWQKWAILGTLIGMVANQAYWFINGIIPGAVMLLPRFSAISTTAARTSFSIFDSGAGGGILADPTVVTILSGLFGACFFAAAAYAYSNRKTWQDMKVLASIGVCLMVILTATPISPFAVYTTATVQFCLTDSSTGAKPAVSLGVWITQPPGSNGASYYTSTSTGCTAYAGPYITGDNIGYQINFGGLNGYNAKPTSGSALYFVSSSGAQQVKYETVTPSGGGTCTLGNKKCDAGQNGGADSVSVCVYSANTGTAWSSTICGATETCTCTSSTSCACSPGTICTSHVSSACYNGDVYWYNSCGAVEGLKQDCVSGCTAGVCGCTSQASYKCYNNDIYWYDSCNTLGSMKTECGASGCSSGAQVCTTCTVHASQSCYSGNLYWYNSCGERETVAQTCSCGCSGTACIVPCTTLPSCGNGACVSPESCSTCPADCGPCTTLPSCGNGACVSPESCSTCPQDCGSCTTLPICSNHVCEAGESYDTCPQDCSNNDQTETLKYAAVGLVLFSGLGYYLFGIKKYKFTK